MRSSSRRDLITGQIASGAPRDGHISHLVSLVVHARPDELGAIRAALTEMRGVEIHGESDAGKMVITLETANDHDIVEAMGVIGELPGVLSTALVYQHSDPREQS
jgi:periplasmic nitrate reductase NapD